MDKDLSAVLLLSCKDRKGLVSQLSNVVFEHGGNILDLDEHVDTIKKYFFVRIAWDMKNFSIPASEVAKTFAPIAKQFNADWKINFAGKKLRVAIFVSKLDHFLQEILWRQKLSEFNVDIPLIISNHGELKLLADYHSILFLFFR